eukprot:TRINITY_DN19561_c0_g1_i1.p1 TRINITY_DN19561_c0_g1~~TRINITY_DN19561_c0_g1_i1.p1  ORF type:complete len:457 (-),score=75.36 TRINITY_DN19561_c0_g1_i1:88-1458(-)
MAEALPSNLFKSEYLTACFQQPDSCPYRSLPQHWVPSWAVEGFGHCPVPGAKLLRTVSLRECLRRCEAFGTSRCRFASFADADVLRRSGKKSRGSCMLSPSCPELRSTTSGAITYRRRNLLGAHHKGSSEGSGKYARAEPLATLSVAKEFMAAQAWHRQMCAPGGGASLAVQTVCEQNDEGMFRLFKVSQGDDASGGMIFQIETVLGGKLCGDDGMVRISMSCELDTWEIVNGRWYAPDSSHTDYEACSWLRVRSEKHEYLVARGNLLMLVAGEALNRSVHSACWAFGFQQPKHMALLKQEVRSDFSLGLPHSLRAEVWLLASQNYIAYLDWMLQMLAGVGEPVGVHVRWAPDLRDVTKTGWDIARQAFVFNSRKLALVGEALLWAATSPTSSANRPVIVLDLDVVIFPGWAHALRSCTRDADVCFVQQPTHPFELANGGVVVLRTVGTGSLGQSN